MDKLRIILLPFSLIYGAIMRLRTWLYRIGFLKSISIPGKSICIGNITVGGTGKSPLTAYLVNELLEFNPFILSRGYGRKTRGLIEANHSSKASEIGDEPMMYWSSFHAKIPVIVAEKRVEGVAFIREKFPRSLIVLDDAFQHQAVRAGLNIVLMTYDRPIFTDFPFPAGNLRENRSALKRADVVLITKSPKDIDQAEKEKFNEKLNFPAQSIFYSSIVYGSKIGFNGESWIPVQHIFLVTGIAQPEPLKHYLELEAEVENIQFSDHHEFSVQDLDKIRQKVATFAHRRCAIVTTEKDAVRLLELKSALNEFKISWFIQKMAIQIDRENEFIDLLRNYVISTDERSR